MSAARDLVTLGRSVVGPLPMAAPAPGAGWIGDWSPGIGDPTVGGWLTVLLYAVAAFACTAVLRSTGRMPRRERWFWMGMLAAMVFLGVNKQLDLQSALTELGRIVLRRDHLYAERRVLQQAFVAAVAVGAAAVGLSLGWLVSGAPRWTWIALGGAVSLAAFVVIRAASFHHVDVLIGSVVAGLRLNWLLEMGSLAVVITGAAGRARAGQR